MTRSVRVLLVVLAMVLAGCEPYALRGKVVPGRVSMVELVAADDPRLDQRGLEGAEVLAMLEPSRVTREVLGRQMTEADGSFAIRVEKFGAGVLEYDDLLISARAPEHATAERLVEMPGGNKRFLITLGRGETRPTQYGDPLQDTLREAAPYME